MTWPNPNGVAADSPGLPYAATLGERDARTWPNPNGVAPDSPGLPYSATLGIPKRDVATPTGLRLTAQGCRTRLPWGSPMRGRGPTPTGLRLTAQGCRTRLPWGGGFGTWPNPNGVAADSPGLPYSATLGERDARTWPNPNGVAPDSQGCRTRLLREFAPVQSINVVSWKIGRPVIHATQGNRLDVAQALAGSPKAITVRKVGVAREPKQTWHSQLSEMAAIRVLRV